MSEASALGSIDDCVRKLQEFKDAGADEIATYGNTPGQNARLVAAWREHSTTRRPETVR
jgi:5,10-methylenetetrahydromethanopterin reductase